MVETPDAAVQTLTFSDSLLICENDNSHVICLNSGLSNANDPFCGNNFDMSEINLINNDDVDHIDKGIHNDNVNDNVTCNDVKKGINNDVNVNVNNSAMNSNDVNKGMDNCNVNDSVNSPIKRGDDKSKGINNHNVNDKVNNSTKYGNDENKCINNHKVNDNVNKSIIKNGDISVLKKNINDHVIYNLNSDDRNNVSNDNINNTNNINVSNPSDMTNTVSKSCDVCKCSKKHSLNSICACKSKYCKKFTCGECLKRVCVCNSGTCSQCSIDFHFGCSDYSIQNHSNWLCRSCLTKICLA